MAPSSTVVKVAAVQSAPVAFDLDATLDKLDRLTAEAAAKGAQLVVFPEAFVCAYPKLYDFGAVVGNRTPEGRKWFRKYIDSSVTIPSPAFDRLCAAAATNKVFLQVGIIERDGGTIYCCAVLISPSGELVYKHRKLMPTGSERLVWGFGDGSGLHVAQTELGKIGSVICWENFMPSMRMAMYQKNIEIYLAPTADGRETWPPLIQTIAQEGRCFTISVNQFSTRKDYPEDYPPFAGKDDISADYVVSAGGSCIVSPLGQFLAGPCWNKEETLYADLEMDQIAEGKMDFDVVGHYSRPDIFQLKVDTSQRIALLERVRLTKLMIRKAINQALKPHFATVSVGVAAVGCASDSWAAVPFTTFPAQWPYTEADMRRMDPSPDSNFYSSPRFVTHIDDHAIGVLEKYYASVHSEGMRVLDICSSWVSHIPSYESLELHGLGMNEVELKENPALQGRYKVIDLNVRPAGWKSEYGGAQFDSVICTVSIDYLEKPREVLSEVASCLKPGGYVHLAISNRCFPTKVVGRWLRISEEERLEMVAKYFHFARSPFGHNTDQQPQSNFEPGQLYGAIEKITLSDGQGWTDPLWIVRAKRR
ncbi:Nitrilase [Saitoella coloradoensis]